MLRKYLQVNQQPLGGAGLVTGYCVKKGVGEHC